MLGLFIGICREVQEIDLSNWTTLGAVLGTLSGLTFAMLALVNRENARISDPVAVAFSQNLFAAACLVMPILLIHPPAPVVSDLPPLSSPAWNLCTALYRHFSF